MFDLEDAVSLREKDSARLLVFHALQLPVYRDIETVVRINPLSTPFGLLDLEAAVRGGVDVVRLPKTDTAEDVHELEREVERIETRMRPRGRFDQADGGDRIGHRAWSTPWPSPPSSPRLIGIALAGFDYVMDMQTERGDGTELFYARCAVLHAARARQDRRLRRGVLRSQRRRRLPQGSRPDQTPRLQRQVADQPAPDRTAAQRLCADRRKKSTTRAASSPPPKKPSAKASASSR